MASVTPPRGKRKGQSNRTHSRRTHQGRTGPASDERGPAPKRQALDEKRQAAPNRQALGQLDLEVVEQVCREQGHRWRKGKLPPGRTIECFAWQVLMGNETCDAVRRSVWVGGVRRTLTLVTTLTDARKYPAKQLAKLLGERWAIEVDLRSLKTTMGMERLRCQSVEGVRKELVMHLIVYNLVRMRMLRAAARQKVPLARMSFADALAALRYGRDGQADLKVNPDRPGRSEPRVVKTKPKAYPKMSKPRPQLRRELKARRKAAFA